MDYFQIECYELGDMVGTMERSGKINRHRRSYDIEIKPCTNYVFKVSSCMFCVNLTHFESGYCI